VGTPDDKPRPNVVDPWPLRPVRDENGDLIPHRWERPPERAARKAAEKAARRTGPDGARKSNQVETVLGTVIGVAIMLGVLVLFGLALHGIFHSYPN
jgi:hypothetical protein